MMINLQKSKSCEAGPLPVEDREQKQHLAATSKNDKSPDRTFVSEFISLPY